MSTRDSDKGVVVVTKANIVNNEVPGEGFIIGLSYELTVLLL